MTHPDMRLVPVEHDSDCAQHNEPAYPNGPCDCSAKAALPPREEAPEGVGELESYWFDPRDPEVTDTNPDSILIAYYPAFEVTVLQCGTLEMFGFWFEPADGSEFQYRYFSDHEQAEAEALAQQAALRAQQPAQGEAGAIVPTGCTGTSLAFEPGVLHVSKDGNGYIAIDEANFELEDDRCEGPDGPEGSVHWITRLDASEVVALRDFLMGTTPAADAPRAWRCFHCDETFTEEWRARQHFGSTEESTPACQLKGADGGLLEAMRRAENSAAEAWNLIHSESTEAAKAYMALTSRHAEQNRAAEQAGYDKGLADAKAHPETLGVAPATDDDRLKEVLKLGWGCAMTVACNIAIDEQNRANDDDAASEILNAQGEIIRRIKGVLDIDDGYMAEALAALKSERK